MRTAPQDVLPEFQSGVMADQRGHTHPQPNGQAGRASPRTVRLRPRASSPRPARAEHPTHAQRSPQAGGSGPRPAQLSTLSGGPSPGRDSAGLMLAQTEELFELIAYSQSQRLDDQRASISHFPELSLALPSLGHRCGACSPQGPGEDFFNMLVKYQSSRIEDQRCFLPEPDGSGAGSDGDEDLFSLIQRVQARRMDEQRALLNTDGQQGSDTNPEAKPATGPG